MNLERHRGPIFLGAVLISILLVVTMIRYASFKDFNLYYYGGKAERAGTYSDKALVKHFARKDAQKVNTQDGVYGAPTLVALVFQPLSYLSLHGAQIIWTIICLAALIFSMILAAGKNWPPWLLLRIALAGSLIGLALGQPSVLTNSLILFCFAFLLTGNEKAAGVSLGLASMFKIYPAFLVVPLIVHRKWRTVKWFVLSCLLLGLLTALALGPHDVGPALRWTFDVARHPSVGYINLSIPWFVARHVSSLSVSLVSTLLLAASVVVVARVKDSHVFDSFALAAMLMLLAQTITWESYSALAIIALLVLSRMKLSRIERDLTIFATVLIGFWWFLFLSNAKMGNIQTVGLTLLTALLAIAIKRRSDTEIAPSA
jgi:hypothetical protein